MGRASGHNWHAESGGPVSRMVGEHHATGRMDSRAGGIAVSSRMDRPVDGRGKASWQRCRDGHVDK